MTNEELIARLHLPWPKDESAEEVTLPAWVLELTAEAADRIEALTKHARIEELEAKVAKLVEAQGVYAELVAERSKVAKLVEAIHRITPYLSASLSELDCGPDYIEACNQVFEADSITLADIKKDKHDGMV